MMRRASFLAAALSAALLTPGCVKKPQLGMEVPGRPVLTWEHDISDAAAPPSQEERDRERAATAALRAAEQTGKEDLTLAQALYDMAIVRRQQNDFADAERLYRRALTIRERELGPDHPDVATTLNNLAGLQAAQGKYAAAQPLLERALAIREAQLGGEHELTAQSLNNLALLYAAQGKAAAAEPLYQRALSILERNAAPRPGEMDRVLDNYAALLHDSGRTTEAEKLEARARVLRATSTAH